MLALVVFFRTYQLVQTPPEMVSDQAEKLLDVWDVFHGQTSIFFPRNTGREAFQMYLTAAVIKLFGTGFSFLSLKIGTVLCGLLTLPFIYGLGKELGGRRAGLFALALAGVAYWPNVISRVGLRFTLYAFFTAPVLYYLLRGAARGAAVRRAPGFRREAWRLYRQSLTYEPRPDIRLMWYLLRRATSPA